MDNLPITVTQNADNSFTIEWDEKHPVTSLLNNWTNADFIEAISTNCEKALLEKRDE